MKNPDTLQWENQLLESFMEMTKASYGDFDAIRNLSKATRDPESFQKIIEHLQQFDQAKTAFEEYFQLGEVDLNQLYRLPSHTFGYTYAAHMLNNRLKPIQIPIIENDYSYLGFHLAQTHDIWHVITGADTSMDGEILLHAFTASQLRFSRFYLAMLAKNLLKTAIDSIEHTDQRMNALTQGWIMGKQSKPLFGIRWNTLWNQPLEQLQTEFNISKPPEKVTAVSDHLSYS